MMRWHFVDAWYFVALANRFDEHHSVALRLNRTVPPENLVTHDGILSEVLTYFGGRGGEMRESAARTARAALEQFTVIPIERDLFLRGLEFYERRADKEYSFADCVSMVIMRDRDIHHVLTNDHHFQQEGFTLVNR